MSPVGIMAAFMGMWIILATGIYMIVAGGIRLIGVGKSGAMASPSQKDGRGRSVLMSAALVVVGLLLAFQSVYWTFHVIYG